MEIILAIVVLMAVVFFGALISFGNERQRKAIDSLCEQITLWALQDLRIKREGVSQCIHIDEPIAWFNQMAIKCCGSDLKLQFLEALDEPQSIIFTYKNGVGKVVFSPLSPIEIKRLGNVHRSRLAQFHGESPFLPLPRAFKCHELSSLNCGILFDLELPIAWETLVGQQLTRTDRLWMYKFC